MIFNNYQTLIHLLYSLYRCNWSNMSLITCSGASGNVEQ